MPKQTELFLLDVSHSLLNAAYRHCCETLPDIRTYTIHGSFLDLPKMPMLVNPLRGRSRLFAMLGWHARQPHRRAALLPRHAELLRAGRAVPL
jgi:hypothetical protein